MATTEGRRNAAKPARSTLRKWMLISIGCCLLVGMVWKMFFSLDATENRVWKKRQRVKSDMKILEQVISGNKNLLGARHGKISPKDLEEIGYSKGSLAWPFGSYGYFFSPMTEELVVYSSGPDMVFDHDSLTTEILNGDYWSVRQEHPGIWYDPTNGSTTSHGDIVGVIRKGILDFVYK